jgi:hypothetical protein
MKIVEFFLIIRGKWSELEPEFLTSWSRSWSSTKIDRLCNTAFFYRNMIFKIRIKTGWLTCE